MVDKFSSMKNGTSPLKLYLWHPLMLKINPMSKTIIRNAVIVNEGHLTQTDILIEGELIAKISDVGEVAGAKEIDARGKLLFPGVIDGQVHFRDPGLTHKADLYTESRAAVAGGTTSFIDMPNTVPNVLNMELLEEKYEIAKGKSLANYGFWLGVNADNLDLVLDTDVSGLLAVSDDGLYFTKKGNLLADSPEIMEKLFANCPAIITIHSEREEIIEKNEEKYRAEYGDDVPVKFHPIIRSVEACYSSTVRALEIAKKYNTRLHILHLSTAKETDLFRNDIPLAEKNITTEVCVHHLWFCDEDYERLGKKIKWNPAIKSKENREGLLEALIDGRIDLITTDHAPHTWEEKDKPYFQSMSGAPLVQHALVAMLEFVHQGKLSYELLAEKMCHNPAILYSIKKRGFIREGYYADLTLVDINRPWTVSPENILYKCGWSPLEGTTFHSAVTNTWVNGHMVYDEGEFDESRRGMRLEKIPQ
ncbi:MAG: dihydroorotase [Cryomorphaceae bacterium]|jgi:dihydroorotase